MAPGQLATGGVAVVRSGGRRWRAKRKPHRRAAWRLAAALQWLPVGLLLLADDASALEVNETWAGLSGLSAADSDGYGWLDAINALDGVVLRRRMHDAAKTGQRGSAEFLLATPGREQWSRWSWAPGPAGTLIACVVLLGDAAGNGPPPRPSPAAELADMVAHRLVGVGLAFQRAAAATDPAWRNWLRWAADEVDSVVRDVRSAEFRRR